MLWRQRAAWGNGGCGCCYAWTPQKLAWDLHGDSHENLGQGCYREKEKLCRPNARCSWSVTKNKNKRRVDGLEAGDWVVGRAQTVPAFVRVVKIFGFYNLTPVKRKQGDSALKSPEGFQMTAEPGHAESLFFTLLWVEPFLLAGETAVWQRKTIHSKAHMLLLFSHRLPGIEHKWWPRGTSSRIMATVELEFHWVFLIPNKRLLSESNCSASANLKCHRGRASYSAPIQLIKLSLENTENSLCECSTLQD